MIDEVELSKDESAEVEKPGKKTRKEPYWLLYTSILISGVVLLSDAVAYAPLEKITAKLGIGLLFTAFALIVGNGRKMGFAATGLIWAAVVATFFF